MSDYSGSGVKHWQGDEGCVHRWAVGGFNRPDICLDCGVRRGGEAQSAAPTTDGTAEQRPVELTFYQSQVLTLLTALVARTSQPSASPQAEDQAFAIVKGIGTELQRAAEALEKAAQIMRGVQGKGSTARELHEAAVRAAQAAQDVLGG